MASLRRGDSGPVVAFLQDLLQTSEQLPTYYEGRIDGDYGPKTAAAVRAFQEEHVPGRPDGICGEDTSAKLKELTGYDLDLVEHPEQARDQYQPVDDFDGAHADVGYPSDSELEWADGWLDYLKSDAEAVARKWINLDQAWWQQLFRDETGEVYENYQGVEQLLEAVGPAVDELTGLVNRALEEVFDSGAASWIAPIGYSVFALVDAWTRVDEMPKRDYVFERYRDGLVAAILGDGAPLDGDPMSHAVGARAWITTSTLSDDRHRDAIALKILTPCVDLTDRWAELRRDPASLARAAAQFFDVALLG